MKWNDGQVKLHRFRIEIGEIQSELGSHLDVETCVVLPESRPDSSKGHADKLVGYYTPSETSEYASQSGADRMRQHLEERLPRYAVPSHIVFVQGQLPLTITGKLDVPRSPSPNYPRILPNVESGIPTTEIEKSLCEMWSA
jgi:bacitracin synthase 1/bacitracin synthase 3